MTLQHRTSIEGGRREQLGRPGVKPPLKAQSRSLPGCSPTQSAPCAPVPVPCTVYQGYWEVLGPQSSPMSPALPLAPLVTRQEAACPLCPLSLRGDACRGHAEHLAIRLKEVTMKVHGGENLD